MNTLAGCLMIACLMIAPIIDGTITDHEWEEATAPIPLYQAGSLDKLVMAELRLGGWIDGQLYGLVQAVDGHRVYACDPDDEYWLKLDGEIYELTDRAFTNEADCLADGFEFFAEVVQGDYALVAHANFDEARDTGQTQETDICIYCPPTAVLGTVSNVRAWHAGPGRVVLRWTQETPWDLGFTLVARDNGQFVGVADCERECLFVDDAAPAVARYNLTIMVGSLRETFGPYEAGRLMFLPTEW